MQDQYKRLLEEQDQEPKTLDQLMEDVRVADGNLKKIPRWRFINRSAAKKELRAAINALKVHWMNDKHRFEVRGREEQDCQAFLDVMEQHFSQKDILDVLNYKKGEQPNYGSFRAFSADKFELETNRPNIQKATHEIDLKLFPQFPNISNLTTAADVIVVFDRLLWVHGLSTKSTDKKGSTILHKVLEQLNPEMPDKEVQEIFTYLAKNGADFNAKDGKGNTPLHIAARRRLVRLKAEEVQIRSQELSETQMRDIGGVVGGAVKILCEEFGAFPEIANNVLQTPFVPSNPSERYAVRINQYLNFRQSRLHEAIERRSVSEFERLMKHYRKNQDNYAREFQNNHPKFGLPLAYLQKLISDYQNEKRIHSPREWSRQSKLKKMMEFYLENLARKMRADFVFLSADANLVAEMVVLSPENQNIVIREMFMYHERTQKNIQAVRDRYLWVVDAVPDGPVPADPANNNNSSNAVAAAPAPVVAAQPVEEKKSAIELEFALRRFDGRKQPVEDLLKLLNELNTFSPKQIADVLNTEKSEFYYLHSSLQADCNFHRIKLWEYTNIWKALLKVTEKRDKATDLQEAVSSNSTAQVVRLINDRKVKIDHGVNGGLRLTLLNSAVNHHNAIVVELLLAHGAKVTFEEIRSLFMITQGYGEYYLEDGKKVNELLQAKFALEQWPAKEILAELSSKYSKKHGYFRECELQAIFSGLSRLTPEEREGILNRQVRVGSYESEAHPIRDYLRVNCEKQGVTFPAEYLVVPAPATSDNNNNAGAASVSQVPPAHLAFKYPPSEQVPQPQANVAADKNQSISPSSLRKSQ